MKDNAKLYNFILAFLVFQLWGVRASTLFDPSVFKLIHSESDLPGPQTIFMLNHNL